MDDEGRELKAVRSPEFPDELLGPEGTVPLGVDRASRHGRPCPGGGLLRERRRCSSPSTRSCAARLRTPDPGSFCVPPGDVRARRRSASPCSRGAAAAGSSTTSAAFIEAVAASAAWRSTGRGATRPSGSSPRRCSAASCRRPFPRWRACASPRCYLPGTTAIDVGGDWFDTITLARRAARLRRRRRRRQGRPGGRDDGAAPQRDARAHARRVDARRDRHEAEPPPRRRTPTRPSRRSRTSRSTRSRTTATLRLGRASAAARPLARRRDAVPRGGRAACRSASSRRSPTRRHDGARGRARRRPLHRRARRAPRPLARRRARRARRAPRRRRRAIPTSSSTRSSARCSATRPRRRRRGARRQARPGARSAARAEFPADPESLPCSGASSSAGSSGPPCPRPTRATSCSRHGRRGQRDRACAGRERRASCG